MLAQGSLQPGQRGNRRVALGRDRGQLPPERVDFYARCGGFFRRRRGCRHSQSGQQGIDQMPDGGGVAGTAIANGAFGRDDAEVQEIGQRSLGKRTECLPIGRFRDPLHVEFGNGLGAYPDGLIAAELMLRSNTSLFRPSLQINQGNGPVDFLIFGPQIPRRGAFFVDFGLCHGGYFNFPEWPKMASLHHSDQRRDSPITSTIYGAESIWSKCHPRPNR